jgi:hypothetical protein
VAVYRDAGISGAKGRDTIDRPCHDDIEPTPSRVLVSKPSSENLMSWTRPCRLREPAARAVEAGRPPPNCPPSPKAFTTSQQH